MTRHCALRRRAAVQQLGVAGAAGEREHRRLGAVSGVCDGLRACHGGGSLGDWRLVSLDGLKVKAGSRRTTRMPSQSAMCRTNSRIRPRVHRERRRFWRRVQPVRRALGIRFRASNTIALAPCALAKSTISRAVLRAASFSTWANLTQRLVFDRTPRVGLPDARCLSRMAEGRRMRRPSCSLPRTNRVPVTLLPLQAPSRPGCSPRGPPWSREDRG